jgi:sugar lactone lactonase YvrE
MPWNAVHLVIPLSILAAIGVVQSVLTARRWLRYVAIVAAAATALVSLHNSFTLSYLNAANPVELMVYVQTSPDVPKVLTQLERVQAHQGGPLHIVVDNADEWPWVYYLRDDKTFWTDAYPTTVKDYNSYLGGSEPVLLVDAGNYTQLQGQFASNYVAFREVLRAWGPEEYKTYAQRTYPYKFNAQGQAIPPSGKLLPLMDRVKYFLGDVFNRSTWGHILDWEFSRRPFTPNAWQGDNNQLIFYFLVKKNLVQYLSPSWQAQAQQQIVAAEKADPFYTKTRQVTPLATYGAGAGQVTLSFAGPLAADHQGDTYVVDPNASKIEEIGSNGTLLRSWGTPGSAQGQFHFQYQLGSAGGQTSGIAVGPNGNVYVADTWNQRIQEFSPAGAFIRAWGTQTPNQDLAHPKPNEFYGPRGIAIAPNGDVYVADTGNKRIEVFDANGTYRFSFGSSGSGPGQFDEPSSLAIGQGHVYVADFWNRRIQTFDLQGHLLGQFAVPIWQANSYDEPAIAVDAQGHIYVPDSAGARILIYTPSGQPYRALNGILNQAQVLTKPLSIAIGADGSVLVSDAGANKVLRFAAP